MIKRYAPAGGLLALLCCFLVAGCSSIPAAPREDRAEYDPWEPLNRQIHGFNRTYDRFILKPIAQGYEFIFPEVVRIGIRNFSSNLRTPLNAIGAFLQGKGKNGATQTVRFVYNSTFGILGILDVATPLGFERQNEDFGQVFAHWGIPDGPFIIIPLIGPSTVRDGLALPLDILADPLIWYDNASVRDKLWGLRYVDVRQALLSADVLTDQSADPYITIREAYLQNRLFLIYDSNPPVEEDEYFDEFFDEEEFLDEEEPQ